jgi:thiol-disulfide isomerase/thioredoxin
MLAALKSKYAPYVMFCIGVVLIFLWARSRRVEGFADAPAAADSYKFKMYFAEWCPHCHTAMPEFKKLGTIQTIGGKRVECLALDEAKNPEEVKAAGVQGYPTFQLYGPDGKMVKEYGGERTTAGFQSFLDSVLNRPRA